MAEPGSWGLARQGPEGRAGDLTPLLCFPGELSALYAQCAQGVPGERTDQSFQVRGKHDCEGTESKPGPFFLREVASLMDGRTACPPFASALCPLRSECPWKDVLSYLIWFHSHPVRWCFCHFLQGRDSGIPRGKEACSRSYSISCTFTLNQQASLLLVSTSTSYPIS